jgi:hypothetical protein
MNRQPTSQATKRAVASLKKPTHDQIAARAHQLYVQNGRQEGRDMEYWLRAEKELANERAHGVALPTPSQPHELGPRPQRPFARDERGSATREEIRRETSPMRPASRQSLRPQERSGQSRLRRTFEIKERNENRHRHRRRRAGQTVFRQQDGVHHRSG